MIQLFSPLVTPFEKNESLDLGALMRNVERYEATPLDGYVVNGSSGEAEMLSEEERLQALKVVCESTSRKVVAGLNPTSTVEALRQMEMLADYRLEAVLIRTPSYFGRQLDQVDFFREVARSSPHPVLVYQIPQYTGVKLAADEVREIARLENVAGMKDSLGDLALLNEVTWPAGFRYLLGASAVLQPGVAAGAHGGILALANVVPELCRRLLELSADPARQAEARGLQQRLIPLNRMLGGSAGYGLAGLKAACEMRGYEAGPPRRPLRRLGETEKGRLRATLSELLAAQAVT